MCSATRYSLLTGRFAHRAYLKHQGWLPHGPNTPMIQRALKTLPEMLQSSGYRTAGIGKYHVGVSFDNGEGNPAVEFHYHDVDFTKPLLDGPTHHGFDEYFGVPGNTEDPLDTEPRIMIRNDRLVFTKLDETTSYGSLLNVVTDTGLPVSYLTDGQMVPEDLAVADPDRLARLVLRGQDDDA